MLQRLYSVVLTKKNILITGQPGIGKTTFIKKLAEALNILSPAGFYTAEIREKSIRKGFELISLSGAKGLLSHIDIKSPHRVSKYGVDIGGFDIFLGSISFFAPATKIIIIDEIGKMECFSEKFRTLMKRILDSDKISISTIALKGCGLIAEVKKREDVNIFEISMTNRDYLLSEILKEIGFP